MEVVLEVLEEGTRARESRDKVRITKRTKSGLWEIVIVDTTDQIKLVHFKKVRGW